MAEFEHLEELVVGLYDRGVIGCASSPEEFITLKSGRESPHYANFRGIMSIDRDLNGMSFDEQMRVTDLTIKASAQAVRNIKKRRNFDHFSPIPQAVTQLGGAVAREANVSSLNVRVKEGEKGYGKHQPVEGNYGEGDTVVGFDDVVTTGEAKKEFLEPMELAKLVVVEFVVILDRQEGGRSKVETSGYGLSSVFGMYIAKEILRDNRRVTAGQYGYMTEYLDQYGDLSA